MSVRLRLIVTVCVYDETIERRDAAEFTKEVEVPFTPWVGLQIRDVDGGRDPHVIDELEWQLKERRFDALCEEEHWESTAEEIQHEMTQNGWS